MRPLFLGLTICLLTGGSLSSQTTQGMITGRVLDSSSSAPITNASIEYEQLATNTHGTTFSGPGGYYFVPLLPPGSYRIRVSVPGNVYQAGEAYNVILTVAGYSRIDFDLNPLRDVWQRGRFRSLVFRNNTVASFFGPDIDPSYVGTFDPERWQAGQLEPSISQVIDPRTIATLPLAGRDVYTALVLQPGVTADNATARSLGLSANGQRVTSSNFLLDGAEQNDLFLSGPILPLAPEMVQEYRVSTNNFSAEYGRTSGYVANVVTRSGAAHWHGIAYGDLGNSALNANTFQHNLAALPRNSLHQIEGGISAGGTVPHTRLLTWTAFDIFGSRSFTEPQTSVVPTKAFFDSLAPASRARQILSAFPPHQWADSSSGDFGLVTENPPVTFRRKTALERLDYAISEKQHVMARIAAGFERRPDFNWSEYGEAPLTRNTWGPSVAFASRWSPFVVSDIRGSFLSSSRGWDLALAELPALGVGSLLGPVQLPGHCCEVSSIDEGWHDRSRIVEISGNLTFTRGAHVVKTGADLLDHRSDSRFVVPTLGHFSFLSLSDFAADRPFESDSILSHLNLESGRFETPDTRRTYRDDQVYLFVQEDWRISPRLILNGGLRYDRFPAPQNIGGAPDVLVLPGAGMTRDEQIASATLAEHRGSLFPTHPDNWSIRLAFSLALSKSKGTVLRGGYGIFYDRIPGNLAVTATANDLTSTAFLSGSCPLEQYYQARNHSVQPVGCAPEVGALALFDLTRFQPGLRAPRIHSYFLSLQQPLSRNLALEWNGTGSVSNNLLTTDIENRQYGILPPANGLPNIDYRTNHGFSNYHAFSSTLRYRGGPLTLNATYTWSHSIDNQSDPLLGGYFDLGFSSQTDRSNQGSYGAFTYVGDNRTDRGNSDFDQKHNFVGWASVTVPSTHLGRVSPLLRNWSAATVFAARSGLPFSVFGGTLNCFPVCNTRADLISSAEVNERVDVPGGVQLLSPAAFTAPLLNQTGNTGRNAFRGPGFYNIDFSLARTFSLQRLGEQTRLIVRADAFNVLNHANLQNPSSFWGLRSDDGSIITSSAFGIASYGDSGVRSGFPTVTPLIVSPRQVHFLLRLEF